MKKTLLLLSLFASVLAVENTFAQKVEEPCGTTHLLNEWLNESEENAIAFEKNWESVHKFIKENPNFKRDAKYRIPVVFHVLHLGGSENVPHQELQDLLDYMNTDMQAENPGADWVRAYMPDLVGVADFEYRMATKDPMGNPTNGVVREYSELTDSELNYSNSGRAMKEPRQWDVNRYLNIYVVRSIGSSGVAGYAQFPNGNAATDAIVLNKDLTTTNRGGSTHEFGHFYGLCHTWSCFQEPAQSGNCSSDDNISDTPNCIGIEPGSQQCTNQSINTCDEGGGDRPDNFQNYMDYSYCFGNFTPDQIAVMHANAENNARRKSLWQPATITSTGSDYDDMPDAPVAAFYPSIFDATVCPGSAVSFTYDGFDNVTTFAWEFPGATPSTSSEENPTVSYANGGTYSATLTVSNASGSHTYTYENVVEVFGASAIQTPFEDDFNSVTDLTSSGNYIIDNVDGDARTWEINSNVGVGGGSSVWIYNRINGSGRIDRLITNPLNLAGKEEPMLSFNFAFAQKGSSNTDRLVLYVSEDCGVTYQRRKTFNGKTSLKTADNTTGNFQPSDEEWGYYELDLSSYEGKSIQVMFEFESGGGNNIYLDNFKVSAQVGIGEKVGLNNFSIAPNPMTDVAQISFDVKESTNLNISLYDLTGRKVQQLADKQFVSGTHNVAVEKRNLPSGVYLVSIGSANGNSVHKLIIE